MTPQAREDNRPYNVAKIQACVAAAMPATTGSTTPTTITKEKGNTLQSCIKNAREVSNTNAAAIEALLKKVEELRAEIAKLKASVR